MTSGLGHALFENIHFQARNRFWAWFKAFAARAWGINIVLSDYFFTLLCWLSRTRHSPKVFRSHQHGSTSPLLQVHEWLVMSRALYFISNTWTSTQAWKYAFWLSSCCVWEEAVYARDWWGRRMGSSVKRKWNGSMLPSLSVSSSLSSPHRNMCLLLHWAFSFAFSFGNIFQKWSNSSTYVLFGAFVHHICITKRRTILLAELASPERPWLSPHVCVRTGRIVLLEFLQHWPDRPKRGCSFACCPRRYSRSIKINIPWHDRSQRSSVANMLCGFFSFKIPKRYRDVPTLHMANIDKQMRLWNMEMPPFSKTHWISIPGSADTRLSRQYILAFVSLVDPLQSQSINPPPAVSRSRSFPITHILHSQKVQV